MSDLHERSATELAAAIRAGELSAAEVVAAFLARACDLESSLHAWAYLDGELALREARMRDAEPPRGVLHGIPVGVKDIIDTADMPTAYGSVIYERHQPDRDAVVVTRLRDAGAIVLGKNVTTEFALFQPPPTVNPLDHGRTPGGSSSGSAAAVAARAVPLALGTQTAGSVVRPASFCGILGAKPTFGLIPTDGVKPCSQTLDTVGGFANEIDDLALILGVLAGDSDALVPAAWDDRARLGFCRTPQWDQLEASTRTLLEAAVDQLADHLDVVEMVLPPAFDGLVDAQQTIMAVEARDALEHERTHRYQGLSDSLRGYLEEGVARRAGYEDALALASRCRAQLPEVFADVAIVVAPSVLGEAPPAATTGDPLLCRLWTLLGTPAISVPGLTGPHGLPLGMQVVAPLGRDALVLAGAARIGPLLAEATPGTSASPVSRA